MLQSDGNFHRENDDNPWIGVPYYYPIYWGDIIDIDVTLSAKLPSGKLTQVWKIITFDKEINHLHGPVSRANCWSSGGQVLGLEMCYFPALDPQKNWFRKASLVSSAPWFDDFPRGFTGHSSQVGMKCPLVVYGFCVAYYLLTNCNAPPSTWNIRDLRNKWFEYRAISNYYVTQCGVKASRTHTQITYHSLLMLLQFYGSLNVISPLVW